LDAKLTLTSEKGERIVSLSDFYTGFMTNDLLPDEIITEISIPSLKGEAAYTKFGRRQANTPSIVTVAANLVFDGEIVREARIALNAVGPHPFRATKAEKLLTGKILDDQAIGDAAEMAVEECEPFTDPIASEWYRRKMVPVIVKRTLKKITS
jgi:CO/xanthine dehydrogenase FAD-binding subunit